MTSQVGSYEVEGSKGVLKGRNAKREQMGN